MSFTGRIWLTRKKDPGHFGAIMYCTIISMFLLMPAFGLLDIFLNLETSQRKTGVVIYILLVAVGVIYRYYGENRLKRII